MSGFADLILLFLVVFAGSFAVALVASAHRRAKRPQLDVASGQVFRLLTTSGGYRSHFIEFNTAGLRISAPLYRDCYVPLRVGETIVVQTANESGFSSFRSVILDRDKDSHELVIALPSMVRKAERRCEPRIVTFATHHAVVNGKAAWIENLSAWGACLLTSDGVAPGDIVILQFQADFGEARGYALDSKSASRDGKLCRQIRIRFEEPLSGLLARHS